VSRYALIACEAVRPSKGDRVPYFRYADNDERDRDDNYGCTPLLVVAIFVLAMIWMFL
jgi:hypothetical protein